MLRRQESAPRPRGAAIDAAPRCVLATLGAAVLCRRRPWPRQAAVAACRPSASRSCSTRSALPGGDRERLADRAAVDCRRRSRPACRSGARSTRARCSHESLAAARQRGRGRRSTPPSSTSTRSRPDAPAGSRERASVRSPSCARCYEPDVRDAVGQPRQRGARGASATDVANLAGITGAGITVAIIDSEWESLNDTMAASPTELPASPGVDAVSRCTATGTHAINASKSGRRRAASASTARRRPRW